MASCMGCLAGCAQLVMRAVVFFFCLLLLILSLGKHFSTDEKPPSGPDDSQEQDSIILNWFILCLFDICALLGLYGSCTRDPRSLKLFAILLTLGTLVLVYTAYKSGHNREQAISEFNKTLTDDFEDYTWPPGTNPATRRWDYVQGAYRCCGLRNSSEWFHQRNRPKELAWGLLPESCCHIVVNNLCWSQYARSPSCLYKYEEALYRFAHVIKLIASVLVLVAIFALLITERKSPAATRRPVFARFNQATNSVQTWRVPAPLIEKESTRMYPNAPPPPSYTFN